MVKDLSYFVLALMMLIGGIAGATFLVTQYIRFGG